MCHIGELKSEWKNLCRITIRLLFVGNLSYFNASSVQEVSSDGEVFETRKLEDVGDVIKLHRVHTWKQYYHLVWRPTH